MCARLYVVPHQGVRQLNIDHIYPYTNKARTTYVMHVRAINESLKYTQSPKPLSDAQVDSKL